MAKKKRRKRKPRLCSCKDRRCRCESPLPARHGRPTDALPGSPDKVAELCRRAERRESLHVPGDLAGSLDPEKFRLRLIQRANGAYVIDTEGEAGGPVIDYRNEQEKKSGANITKLLAPSPGDRMKELRLKAGLSARRASAAMGLSPFMLAKVERRDVAPCLLLLVLAADFYGACLDWLACFEADEGGGVRCLCG